MPLYICLSEKGAVPTGAKSSVAQALTRVHCDLTGAPAAFVHVFFFEDGEPSPVAGPREARFQLSGGIRAGRADALKDRLVLGMRRALAETLGADVSEVAMTTRDVPAKWAMEGGELMPEPGEEAAWLAKHHAAAAAAG